MWQYTVDILYEDQNSDGMIEARPLQILYRILVDKRVGDGSQNIKNYDAGKSV